MNLSIILAEIPWFGKWELETTFYIDLKQWCWFDYRYSKQDFKKTVLGREFDIDGIFLNFDMSFLCFTFILEGVKEQ